MLGTVSLFLIVSFAEFCNFHFTSRQLYPKADKTARSKRRPTARSKGQAKSKAKAKAKGKAKEEPTSPEGKRRRK